MVTSQVSYYVRKIYNVQTIETQKKAKNNDGLEINFLLMQQC